VSTHSVFRRAVLPAIYPLGIIVVTAALIVAVGESLLHLFDPDFSSEFERLELWIAVAFALAILGVAFFLATRPAGSLGKLDQPMMFGKKPLLAQPMPPVDIAARRGLIGTTGDIVPGYALYARNGQIGIAREVIADVADEFGHHRRGFIYTQGVHGANDEMWIPMEAVSAVYPETHSAFLAIAGDEIEAYGWDNPPASFNLRRQREENKLY
jgi:hypothetical protein